MAKRSTKKKTKTSTRSKASSRRTGAKKASTAMSAKKKKSTPKNSAVRNKKSATPNQRADSKSSSKKETGKQTKPAAIAVADQRKTGDNRKVAHRDEAASASPRKSQPAGGNSVKKPSSKREKGKAEKSGKTEGGSKRKALGARSVAEAASEAVADSQGYVYINGRRVRMISTAGQPPIKKQRQSKQFDEQAAAEDAKKKLMKTTLSAKELRSFRNLLLIKRAELVGDLSAMEAAALDPGSGNLSNLPIHMADIGTDTFDQDFNLGLAENERKQLREIDDALMRIANKTYGVCQMTGEPIPLARLEAKPWAKYTIEAARKLEGQWPR